MGACAVRTPSFRIATVSLTRCTSSRIWVETKTVAVSFRRRMISSASRRPMGSRAEAGSSRIRSSGSWTWAPAIPRHCRWPPGSSASEPVALGVVEPPAAF